MTAAKANRATNVQTPGAPAAASSEDSKPEVEQGASHAAADVASKEAEGAQAAPAASKAKATAAKAKATAAPARSIENRPSRAHYADMHSSEIDSTELTSAVLAKDGWVCPAPKPAEIKR